MIQFALHPRTEADPPVMNIEQARFNMIEQQIRTWEVLDPGVLELLSRVKREQFVPAEHRELAFADLEIPLGRGEAMMQPKVEARILQELAMKPHETVYEVGTGSGYLTALLAANAKHVTSAEIHEEFKEQRPGEPARGGHLQRDARRGRQRARAARRVRIRRDRAHGIDAGAAAGIPRPAQRHREGSLPSSVTARS